MALSDDRERELLEIVELAQEQLTRYEEQENAPIAIVGLACRLPGPDGSAEGFWRLSHDAGDAIVEVPPSRWPIDELFDPDPDTPGKMYSRYGGFLTADVAGFDAGFFGVTAREALSM